MLLTALLYLWIRNNTPVQAVQTELKDVVLEGVIFLFLLLDHSHLLASSVDLNGKFKHIKYCQNPTQFLAFVKLLGMLAESWASVTKYSLLHGS